MASHTLDRTLGRFNALFPLWAILLSMLVWLVAGLLLASYWSAKQQGEEA